MAYAHPPCTNAEAFRVLAMLVPGTTLAAAKTDFPGSPDDPFQGHVTTAILLIMCTFSDELARVRRVLRDPEKYLQALRDEVAGQDDTSSNG
jgi:hypothetical protein